VLALSYRYCMAVLRSDRLDTVAIAIVWGAEIRRRGAERRRIKGGSEKIFLVWGFAICRGMPYPVRGLRTVEELEWDRHRPYRFPGQNR
jgi:hypothetical protein